jgi:hypothetical protein
MRLVELVRGLLRGTVSEEAGCTGGLVIVEKLQVFYRRIMAGDFHQAIWVECEDNELGQSHQHKNHLVTLLYLHSHSHSWRTNVLN